MAWLDQSISKIAAFVEFSRSNWSASINKCGYKKNSGKPIISKCIGGTTADSCSNIRLIMVMFFPDYVYSMYIF